MEPSALETWIRLLLAVNTVGTTLVAILVYVWTRGRSSAVADALLVRRVGDLEGRMDRAGQKNSDLTDRVQVMVSRAELEREHQLRSGQIQALGTDLGRLQLSVARVEEQVKEHTRLFVELRGSAGRRSYDPSFGEEP